VELGKLDDRKSSLADVLEPVRARLNAALSRDPNAAVPTPKITPAPALKQDDAKLFALLAESNPDLKGMAAGISSEEKGVALAKKNFYPDVMLGVDYVQTGDALAAGTPGNSKDAIVAMFSINIPLWRNKLRAGVKEAKARREAAVEQRADMNHRLAAGLKMTLFRYRDAVRKITLYRDSLVPQARSALSVAQKAFAGGDADFLETVDAQRLLLEFQLQAERSLANREQRLAEIRMILGDDL
jgi:outer membrane protein TolC